MDQSGAEKALAKYYNQIAKKERIERMKPFEVNPPIKYKTGKAKRFYPGLCHKKAWEYMVYNNPDGGLMVQGLYEDIQCPHSWVELPSDIVFDGVLQRFYNKEDYYREYQITKMAEFTLKEICQKARDVNNVGVWFDC